jgi:hypothetical protein
MATTELTTTDPQAIANTFAAARGDMISKYEALRDMESSPIKEAMAREFLKDAKRYQAAIDGSELKTQNTKLREVSQYWSKILKHARAPGELLETLCKSEISNAEGNRRRMIAAEQQRREQEANLYAAQQRKAELEHLRKIGKTAEAEARAAAPIVPVTVQIDPNFGKPANADEIMVEVWVPKRDEQGDFVFRQGANDDEAAYRTWITNNAAMWHLQSFEYGKTKRLLTDHRGMLQPPGLVIERKFEPRIRKGDD